MAWIHTRRHAHHLSNEKQVRGAGASLPAPTLATVGPAQGGEGQSLIFTGTGFSVAGLSAFLMPGDIPLTSVGFTFDTSAHGTTPFAPPALYSIRITTNGGSVTKPDCYTYEFAINATIPSNITNDSVEILLTLSGSGLDNGAFTITDQTDPTGMTFNSFTVVSDSECTLRITATGAALIDTHTLRFTNGNGFVDFPFEVQGGV